ncbi:MAG: DUF3857 domain-containing protein [Candidatus Riflebacteria bacterium]|nr:DUF3857 domain-containing protein [Candidatus Riflebacteria bacterium]
MKKLSYFLTAVFLGISPIFCDVLYLNEGEEHLGKVEKIDPSTIHLSEVSGKSEFKKSEVAHILFSKIRSGDEISNVASISDPFLKDLLKKAPTASDYPNSDYVILYQKRSTKFNPDGTMDYERRTIYKIFKEPGLDLADQEIYFVKDREELELEFAHTYASDGRVFHLTDDALSEEDIFSSTPEYDRLKKVKFALKNVDLGSVVDFSFKVHSRPPTELRPYQSDCSFGEREPTLCQIVEARTPATFPLEILELQWTASNTPKYTIATSGNEVIRTWTFSDPKGFIPEQNMASPLRLFPRLMTSTKSDWKKIGEVFLDSLEKAAPNQEKLEAFIKEAGVASKTNMILKVQALQESIFQKIRLLSISCYDYAGYDAPSADVTLQKNYGNAFARCVLFFHALKKLGIKAEFGFSSAWQSGGLRQELPCLGLALGPVIKVDFVDKVEYALLDNDYLPFGHIPTWAQGSKAVFFTENGPVWEVLPEGDGVKNSCQQNVFVKIMEDGSMEVKDSRRFNGPFETSLRRMRAAKDKEKKMLAERIVKGVNSKALLGDFVFSDLNDFSAPVVLTLTYKIPDAVQRPTSDLMAFKNYWVSHSGVSASLATRTYPMEQGYTYETADSVFFEIPNNFQWVDWNKRFTYTGSFLAYSMNMSQNGSLLLFNDDFSLQKKEIDTKFGYPQYRECVSIMSALNNQWIVLEKKH